MNLKIFNQNLEKCIFHYDFPFATANSVGIYELCKMAKKKYTVLLSGEGADELFFGYDRYFRYVLISYFINIIPSKKLQLKFIKYNILKNTNYYFIKKLINNNIINFTSTIDVNAIINDRISFFFNNNLRFIENFQIYEIRTHLHELLLRQDKMSMASSVENRVPFLSNNILDYALTLDLRFKMLFTIFKSMRTKLSKIVLKNFALKLFKREFVLRKKNGFSVPLHKYLQSNNILKEFTNNNSNKTEFKLINFDKIYNFINSKNTLSRVESKNYFKIVTILIWLKQINKKINK